MVIKDEPDDFEMEIKYSSLDNVTLDHENVTEDHKLFIGCKETVKTKTADCEIQIQRI